MVALAAQRVSGFSIPRMRTKIMATRIRARVIEYMINTLPCEYWVVYTYFIILSIGEINKKSPILLCDLTNVHC